MTTLKGPTKPPARQERARQFSLPLYLLIVFALSWPFQIAYVVLGDPYRPLLLVSMVMAGVATFLCGRFVFADGFARAGWRWGRPRHYVYGFLLALFLWLAPSIIERMLGIYEPTQDWTPGGLLTLFLGGFAATMIPAFGEEFSWRGYLLPRLFTRSGVKRALLLHGLITWLWHLPVVVVLGLSAGSNPAIWIPLVLFVSLIPTVMHAIVFAYIWSASNSLTVVTFYHICFDEVRDALEGSVGLGPLAQNFQMVALTVLGLVALFRARWKTHVSQT